MRRTSVLVTLVAVTVTLAACGDDGEDSGGGSGDETTEVSEAGRYGDSSSTTAVEAEGASLVLAGTEYGEIVIDADSSLTVYVFTDDTTDTSTCVDACEGAWPPVAGPAQAGDGLDADAVGTTTRPDGSTQATYHGHPLYTYAADEVPGDTKGEGVGGKWFVVNAGGDPVRSATGGSSGDDGY